jgi:hypothetical protein
VLQQRPGGAGAVSADEDRVPVPELLGDLRERRVQDLQVVGGGVAPGVTGAEQPGQRLMGVVAERQQRVIPERAFECGAGLFLLRVGDHDGGVQVDDQHGPAGPVAQVHPGHPDRWQRSTGQLRPAQPGDLTGSRAGGAQGHQVRLRDRVQDPPAGGVRGDRPEHGLLVAEGGDVADRGPTIGDHHRQIDQHPARVVRGLRSRPPGQSFRQRGREPGPVGHLRQQSAAGVRHQIRPRR